MAAEPMSPLTTEDYTHEEAIARIEELETGIDEAISLLEKGEAHAAEELLEDLLGEEEPEDEDEDEDDEEDDKEDDE